MSFDADHVNERLEALERRTSRFDGAMAAVFAFAALAVIASLVAVGFGYRAIDESKRNVARQLVATTPSPSSTIPGTTTTSTTTPAPALSTVALSEYKVTANAAVIGPGQATLSILNAGHIPHELLVFRSDLDPAQYPLENGDIQEDGPGITKISDGDNLDPGTSQSRTVDFRQPGKYLLVCNLPGHFKQGMYVAVTVR